MRELINQVKEALDSGLYYLALYVALTLPDILGALQSSNGWATSEKYKEWFDEYVAPKYTVRGESTLDGEICYDLRCSILHQGQINVDDDDFSRVIFAEPEKGITIHNNVLNEALQIDVEEFCRDVIDGAEQWIDENEDDEKVQENYENYISRHPNGLPPYISGVPVIS